MKKHQHDKKYSSSVGRRRCAAYDDDKDNNNESDQQYQQRSAKKAKLTPYRQHIIESSEDDDCNGSGNASKASNDEMNDANKSITDLSSSPLPPPATDQFTVLSPDRRTTTATTMHSPAS